MTRAAVRSCRGSSGRPNARRAPSTTPSAATEEKATNLARGNRCRMRPRRSASSGEPLGSTRKRSLAPRRRRAAASCWASADSRIAPGHARGPGGAWLLARSSSYRPSGQRLLEDAGGAQAVGVVGVALDLGGPAGVALDDETGGVALQRVGRGEVQRVARGHLGRPAHVGDDLLLAAGNRRLRDSASVPPSSCTKLRRDTPSSSRGAGRELLARPSA